MKMQMVADVFVAQAHADALAAPCACLHADGAARFHPSALGARLYKKPSACILRIGKPRFHRRLFCSDGATESAVAADFALLAADDIARHRRAMPAQ